MHTISYANFDKFVNDDIKEKQSRDVGALWHKNIKNATGYSVSKNMIDLKNGPIITNEEHQKLILDERYIE